MTVPAPLRAPMQHATLTRRLTLLATALVTLGGAAAVTASTATADEKTAPVEAGPADGYWACLAIEHVDVGTCIRNPLPDLSGMPSVPERLRGLLG